MKEIWNNMDATKGYNKERAIRKCIATYFVEYANEESVEKVKRSLNCEGLNIDEHSTTCEVNVEWPELSYRIANILY